MKKTIFTVQVFCLIAMFPLYLILELNHGTQRVPSNIFPSIGIEKPAKRSIQPSVNSTVENEDILYSPPRWLLAGGLTGSLFLPG
jgi:hypothetical protein